MRFVLVLKGGKGSGHKGHAGRHGHRGGSVPGRGHHEKKREHEHRKKRSYHFHSGHKRKVEEKKPKQLSFLPKPKKPESPETIAFSDSEIPKGWRKFSHESIVRGTDVKKVYIFKYGDKRFSMQRRKFGNPVDMIAPEFESLDKAIRRSEKWLEEA